MDRRTLVLAIGTFAIGTDAFIIAGLLPQMAASFNLSVTASALAVSLFSGVYAVGAPVLAAALGHRSKRALLIASMAVFVAANAACAFAPTFRLLLVARVVAALASACFTPNATAVAAAISAPERRGRSIAVVTGGLAAATVVGVPLGVVCGNAWGWRASFGFVAVIGVLALLALTATLGAGIPAGPRASLGVRLSVLKDGPSLTALLVTMVSMSGIFVVYTYLVPIVDRTTVLASNHQSSVFFVYGAGAVLGTGFGGWAVDRWGSAFALNIAMGSMAVALAGLSFLTLFSPSLLTTGAVFLAVFVWGALGWAFNPAQSHRLVALAGPHAPILLSLNASALHAGIAIGAALGGAVFRSASPNLLGWVGAAIQYLALAFLVLSVALQGRRRIPAPTAVSRTSRAPRSSTMLPVG